MVSQYKSIVQIPCLGLVISYVTQLTRKVFFLCHRGISVRVWRRYDGVVSDYLRTVPYIVKNILTDPFISGIKMVNFLCLVQRPGGKIHQG